MAVLDNGLTINDCRLAAEVGSGTDDRGIPVTPIISIASEDTGFSSLNQHLGAITIVFDFVNPVLALWWLINQGGKLGLDEPKPCHYTNIGGRSASAENGTPLGTGRLCTGKGRDGRPGLYYCGFLGKTTRYRASVEKSSKQFRRAIICTLVQ